MNFPQLPVGAAELAAISDSNLRLSEARAEAVRQYFLDNSAIDESLLSSIGYGETRPIANNETQEGRSRNRRIDIAIVPAGDSF